MTIKLTIKHIGKINKTGKLTVSDENGKKLLCNLPIALPLSIADYSYNQKAEFMTFNLDENIPNVLSDLEKEVKNYEDAFNLLTNNGLNKSAIYDNEIIIAGNENFINDTRSFIMLSKDFKNLCQIVKDEEMRVEIRVKLFIFFTKNVCLDEQINLNEKLSFFKKAKLALAKAIDKKKEIA